MVPKLAGVYCAPLHLPHAFTTLLMSTGLTFGTIASLYGLNRNHRLDAVLAAARRGRPVGDRADDIAQRSTSPRPTIRDAAEMAEVY
jgi:hypothetical protein